MRHRFRVIVGSTVLSIISALPAFAQDVPASHKEVLNRDGNCTGIDAPTSGALTAGPSAARTAL